MKLSRFKKSTLLKAFLINLVFFILALLLCDQKYEVSDDYMIDAVLSGAYGDTYNPVMLFSNTILGYYLVFLYKLIPVGSIYFYHLLLSSFFCLTCITYIILRRNNSSFGILLSVILISFFSDDLYISITFTKVAVVQLIVGGIFIIFSFEPSLNQRYECFMYRFIGFCLFLLGSFLRVTCIPISLGFLFILFIYYFIQHKWTVSTKQLLLFCVSIIIITYTIYYCDQSQKLASESSKDYIEIHPYINKVENLYKFDYETMKSTYDELNLSQNDFQMLFLWNFVDESVFTKDVISRIGESMEEEVYKHTKSASFCFEKLSSKHYYLYPSLWGLCLIFLLLVIHNKQQLPYGIALLTLASVFLYYCVYTGKLPYRVEFSIFLCATISMTYLIENNNKSSSKFNYILCILLLLLKVPVYMPDYSYRYMDDSNYYDYVVNAMTKESRLCYERYTVDLNHRRILGNLIDTIEKDNEHYYLIAFNPYIQILYYNYKPWERIPMGYLKNNYNYIGGVNYKLKCSDDALSANGIDPQNPNKSLIDNERLIWVEAFEDLESAFLSEHYCDSLQSHYLGYIDYADLWQFTSN